MKLFTLITVCFLISCNFTQCIETELKKPNNIHYPLRDITKEEKNRRNHQLNIPPVPQQAPPSVEI